MAFIGAVIWLAITIRVIFVLIYLLCAGIKWLFSSDEEVRAMKIETGIWEKAKRERLTREEKARRYFALFPVQEVPRVKWPTSYER